MFREIDIYCWNAERGKESKSVLIVAKVSQEAFAEMIGTTRARCQPFHEQISAILFY
jgi:hypothetical protein